MRRTPSPSLGINARETGLNHDLNRNSHVFNLELFIILELILYPSNKRGMEFRLFSEAQ